MRISTLQMYTVANSSIGEANREIAKTQTQISTGQRVLTPADDPVAAVKMMELDHNLARLEQYQKNIDIAENNLSLEESTLDSVLNLIQRVREVAVQAGNTAVYTDSEYDAFASEIDARISELQSLMNTQNASGDYIFAGYKGGDKPFVGDANFGFAYQGTDGQVSIRISDNAAVATSDSGKKVFVDIPAAHNTVTTAANSANRAVPPAVISFGQIVDQEDYDAFYPEDMVITFQDDASVAPPGKNFTITERSTGNVIGPYENYPYNPGDEIVVHGVSVTIMGAPASANGTAEGDKFFINSAPNQDILTTLARFSDAMKRVDGTQESKGFLSDIVADTLDNLNNAQVNILETTSSLGARFNTLESTRELHQDTELLSQEILADLRDLDYAEAASRLSAQTMILQAAQAAFTRVSQLSLFSRL
ncbi:MAG: flagellar hook-associated protein 3 [Gammaproteobacteria bacterium]|nr:flagellar hook-associated protein 3 [Gammaproteobacteria bacterium]